MVIGTQAKAALLSAGVLPISILGAFLPVLQSVCGTHPSVSQGMGPSQLGAIRDAEIPPE